MNSAEILDNVKDLLEVLEEAKVDYVVLTRPGFISWALGLPYDVAQTLTLIASREGVTVLSPPLEAWRVKNMLKNVEVVVYTGRLTIDPELFSDMRVEEGKAEDVVKKLVKGKVGSDDTCMAAKLGLREVTDLSRSLWRKRMVKKSWEIEAIKEAVKTTEEAIRRVVELLREEMSEAEVAGLLELEMRRLGAFGLAFPSIVAFSSYSVYPHSTPRIEAKLERETPVLIDAGARVKNYCGDVTRTLWYGSKPDKEWLKILEVVENAVVQTIDAIQSGAEAKEIDAIARKALGEYSRYFIHSLGHGIGVEVHEEPRVSPGSSTKLEKGMVFTVEPGIYIPGKFGIRIEQVVVVEERGCKVLNTLPARLEV